MYKKHKNIISIIINVFIILLFLGVFYFVICGKYAADGRKEELLIQVAGMFITTIALLLTYSSLKNEQKQKNLNTMPYLILEDIDFAVEKNDKGENQLDFDFSIVNKGTGIAKNITVKIRKEKNKKILFSKTYARLEVISDESILILSNIRDEINKLVNLKDDSGGKMFYTPYFSEKISDEFYVYNYENEDGYRNLLIKICYFDIYGKKYKGKFKIKLDNNNDLSDLEEYLEEWE